MSEPFEQEIGRLAERARDESLRARYAAEPSTKRRLSRLLVAGALLIGLGLAPLAVMHGIRRAEITTVAPVPNPLLAENSCRGEVYRTYRRIIRHLRAHDSRPPATLGDLLSTGEPLPADPVSGRSLVYSTDGIRFSVRCP